MPGRGSLPRLGKSSEPRSVFPVHRCLSVPAGAATSAGVDVVYPGGVGGGVHRAGSTRQYRAGQGSALLTPRAVTLPTPRAVTLPTPLLDQLLDPLLDLFLIPNPHEIGREQQYSWSVLNNPEMTTFTHFIDQNRHFCSNTSSPPLRIARNVRNVTVRDCSFLHILAANVDQAKVTSARSTKVIKVGIYGDSRRRGPRDHGFRLLRH